MIQISDKGISYSGAFFILIAMAFGGMMLAGMLSIPIIMLMSGKGITAITEVMKNPAFYREMQVMQGFSAILGFLAPTIFTAMLISRRPLELTGLKGKISNVQVAYMLAIIACGLALSSSLGYLSYQIPLPSEWKEIFSRMENDYEKMAANLVRLDSVFELIISILVLAVLPAICEEAFFRGGLQNYMYRSTKKLWLSLIIVSIIFSAVHFSFYGFLSRVALGMILGLLYHYSGRLWLPVIAHFINNAAAVVAMYIMRNNGKSMAEIMNDKDGTYIGFATIPLIIFLFIKFRQASAHNQAAHGI